MNSILRNTQSDIQKFSLKFGGEGGKLDQWWLGTAPDFEYLEIFWGPYTVTATDQKAHMLDKYLDFLLSL